MTAVINSSMSEKFISRDEGLSPEAKISKDLAKEFIYRKVGKSLKKPVRKECEVLLRLSDEIEKKHDMLLKNMCNRLNIKSDNAYKTFCDVADEVFLDDCNWGRIVVLFAFGGKLAQYCISNNMDMTDKVVNWVGNFISRKSQWIKDKGHGWPGFMEQFRDLKTENEKFWFQGLVATTVGLGTLAAALYIKS